MKLGMNGELIMNLRSPILWKDCCPRSVLQFSLPPGWTFHLLQKNSRSSSVLWRQGDNLPQEGAGVSILHVLVFQILKKDKGPSVQVTYSFKHWIVICVKQSKLGIHVCEMLKFGRAVGLSNSIPLTAFYYEIPWTLTKSELICSVGRSRSTQRLPSVRCWVCGMNGIDAASRSAFNN